MASRRGEVRCWSAEAKQPFGILLHFLRAAVGEYSTLLPYSGAKIYELKAKSLDQ